MKKKTEETKVAINDLNEEVSKKKGSKFLSNISFVLGILLIGFAILLYFTEYENIEVENVKVKFLDKKGSSSNDTKKEKYKIEQRKVVNIIDKHILNLKEKQYNYLYSIRENIYYDIKKYQDKSMSFAEDIMDMGSRAKIVWKSTKDFFKKENTTREYIERIYFHYLFDEEDINKIVIENFNGFNNEFEKNYNEMLSSIVKEIDISGLKILKEKDIEKIIETKLELKNGSIKIEKIELGVKMTFLVSTGAFVLSEKFLLPIVKKIVEGIIVKLTTSATAEAATIGTSSLGGPIAMGTAFIISLGIDWGISNKNKMDIVARTNSKIEDVAKKVSENVYNEIKNNLDREFNRVLQ